MYLKLLVCTVARRLRTNPPWPRMRHRRAIRIGGSALEFWRRLSFSRIGKSCTKTTFVPCANCRDCCLLSVTLHPLIAILIRSICFSISTRFPVLQIFRSAFLEDINPELSISSRPRSVSTKWRWTSKSRSCTANCTRRNGKIILRASTADFQSPADS